MTAAARSLVEQLALMAAQGTVLALVGLVVVRAGRLRPSWQAAVWLIVLIKFVLPWGPALPWSLSDLFWALRLHGDGAPLSGATAAAPPVAPHASVLWLAAALAWLTGAAVVLGRAAAGHRDAVRAARRARPAPASAQALLASFARRPPRLVIGDPAIGPHVVGIWRPIIVIPPALQGDPTLICALLHELAHIRRRDAAARVVQVIANAMFWCWPVVRLVSRRFDHCREAACDAWALDTSEVPRPAYARLLVRMAQLAAAAAPSLAAARGLDARVMSVLGPPARARLGPLHWLSLAAWAVLALGGARSASAHTVCHYTAELAEALRLAHPEADRDGDGVLTRDEACEFQAELRQRAEARTEARTNAPPGTDLVSRPEVGKLDQSLLTEPLCCNCDRGAESSAPLITRRSDTCQSEEGTKE